MDNLCQGDKESSVTDKPIRVNVLIRINAVQAVLVDRLIAQGVYGSTRKEVVRRLFDERIKQLQQ